MSYFCRNKLKRTIQFSLFILILIVCNLLFSCKKEINYFSYVSELRNNIFLAETEEFSLRIYSIQKESPYKADGIPQETSPRLEVRLIAPSGAERYTIYVDVEGKTYGGELSFDNVKTEYFFSCTLDISAYTSLPCRIEYADKTVNLQAQSVLSGKEYTPTQLLQQLQEENIELFSSMTDKYGFCGEIYIRLIYEDNPYYYIGIIDRDGKVSAFLLNALTGKTLAQKTS